MTLKSLSRRTVRTVLTIVSIAIGMAAIVSLNDVASGFVQGYTDLFAQTGAHLVLTQAEGGGTGSVSMTLGELDESLGSELAVLPNVREVAGSVFGFARTSGLPYLPIIGCDPAEFAMAHFVLYQGETLNSTRSTSQMPQILLGRKAADLLEKEVGDDLQIMNGLYQVAGVYETGVVFEDGGAVVLLLVAQDLLEQPNAVTSYLVRLADPDALEETSKQIEERFPEVSVSRPSEFVTQVQLVDTIRSFAAGVSILAVLVGGVGIMNTVVMSVFERTREIGTLRALGWRRWRVFALVLGESLLLSLLGALCGTGLGLLVVKMIKIPGMENVSLGRVTPETLVQVAVLGLGLGFVGGLLPAWWAVRLVPLRALQYESANTRTGRSTHLISWGGTALRNLWRNRTQSLFTVIGTAVGIIGVMTIAGFCEGFMAVFEARSSGSDLVAMQSGIADQELSALDQELGPQIAAIPGVRDVSGGVGGPVDLEGVPLFSISGCDPGSFTAERYVIIQGEPLSSAPKEIVLGKKAAKLLKKEVGDELVLAGHGYRVVGIYETGSAVDEFGGLITLGDAQSVFGKEAKVNYFFVRVQGPDEIDRVRAQIEQQFPDLSVTKSADYVETLPDLKTMRGVTTAVTLLTAVVGIAGVMNTMIMSVYGRTREIGLLGALGWRRRRILWTVMSESLALVLIGGGVGILVSVLIGRLMPLSPQTAGIPMRFTPDLLVQGLGLVMVLGLVGGLYPAWWAMRLMPIEALRYE